MRLAEHHSLVRPAEEAGLGEGRTREGEVGRRAAGRMEVVAMGHCNLQREVGERGHRSNRLVVGEDGRSPAAEAGSGLVGEEGLAGRRRAVEDIRAVGSPGEEGLAAARRGEVGRMRRKAVL